MTLLADISDEVERDPVFGCLLYRGRLDKDGYPIRWHDGRPVRLHRALYQERHGPIADGMEVEHICRRRNCLLDAHHELLSRSQQERAKSWRSRARRQRCKAGHDLALNAAVTPEGGRTCRVCTRSET